MLGYNLTASAFPAGRWAIDSAAQRRTWERLFVPEAFAEQAPVDLIP
jgi:hypothetical protein